MSVVDVIKSCYDSIEQIAEHIEDAIVYMDAGCTESFQFIGAYPLLVEHGARNVCSLENLSPLDAVSNWTASSEPARKLVIMTSRLLTDVHRYIMRCLIMYQGITHCFIFTSISEAAHSTYPDMPLGPDAFHEYESLLLQDYEELLNKNNRESGVPEESKNGRDLGAEEEGWPELHENAISDRVISPVAGVLYGDDTTYEESAENKLKVSVSHFPMIFCALSPKTFVLPSGGSVAEASLSAENVSSLSPGLPPLSLGILSDGEDVIPGATLTANFLHHFASKMDLKLEIFSFGDISKTIGRILTDMPSLYDMGRRKKSAGLLLVDRTLDLLTPCCHSDSFFDRIFSTLPRRESLSLSSTKSLPTQPKQNSRCVHRASLDVQIPLDTIVLEDLGSDKLRLLQGIEAILCGWNLQSPQSEIQGLFKLGSEVNDHKSLNRAKDILKGSFVSAEHFRGTPYLEAVLDRRMKDGAILVKKWLQETLRKDNIVTPLRARPGSATKSELEALLKALIKSDHSLLRNKGIAQLAAATLACLDEAEAAKWDAFMSAEKMLKISAGDTTQNLAAQMVDLINKTVLTLSQRKGVTSDSPQGLLAFHDALLLTCIGFILAGENFPTSGSSGPFSWQEEHSLKEAIVDAIFENPEAAELKFVHGVSEELKAYRSRISLKDSKKEDPENEISIDEFDDDQWGKWGDEEDDHDDDAGKNGGEEAYNDMQLKLELRDRVDNLFRFLHKLSSLKVNNIPLREASLALDAVISGDFYENKGLLYKILTTVLAKRDLPGLEHHSSAVGRLFKSGFGRLGLGQAKPKLADQNVIFVFVVGGLNGVEVREAFEALSESGRPDVELIVGGTTLLTPGDMRELLLGEMSFF